jgi:predicted ABC-type ATPase
LADKSPPQKRLRIFAGPNGSGKSTLYQKIRGEFRIRFGPYINPDQIALSLGRDHELNLSLFGLCPDPSRFLDFFRHSTWMNAAPETAYPDQWDFRGNFVSRSSAVHPYDAAVMADFIRSELLDKGETFSFETVMSHPSKVEFINEANRRGYRTYLYFVATEDSDINRNRVEIRVRKGGHDVPDEKIRSRYKASLSHLYEALRAAYRSFVFDNSNEIKLIAESTPEKKLLLLNPSVPRWFHKAVVEKAAV